MVIEQSVLKSKEGRFVTVLWINSTVKLCAVESQNEGHKGKTVFLSPQLFQNNRCTVLQRYQFDAPLIYVLHTS